MPLVTIGLLTHNRAHLISRSLTSVINQTFTDFELIISDDNSKDATAEVVAPFLSDKRISYIKHPGIGMTANFVEALKLAKSKYFMWLCDDDYISPNYLEKTVAFLEAAPEYSLACGLTIFFSGDSKWNKRDVLYLEENNPLSRLYHYFRHVENNVILFGLMKREEVIDFAYPDTFGGDLLWSCQVAFAGKVKIMEDCFFYYSKEGISQDTRQLAQYYDTGAKKEKNPYLNLRQNAYRLISERNGAFHTLPAVVCKWIAFKVWLIIRDRFCISPAEASLRSRLRLGTRLKALWN